MTDNPSAVRRWIFDESEGCDVEYNPQNVDHTYRAEWPVYVLASDHDATVSALQRELATERAARLKAEANSRFCWLIERPILNSPAYRSMTSYSPEGGWTYDANEAMQFARKKDADDFMAADCGDGEIYVAESVEHGFAIDTAMQERA